MFNPISESFKLLISLSPRMKRFLWKQWYNYLAKMDKDEDMLFMNYGFASPDRPDGSINTREYDERYKYPIQLYDHIINSHDLTGKSVLEVGSGRGGGASHIFNTYHPESYCGVDISDKAIAFCREKHQYDGLIFKSGKAEELPEESNQFDYVVNVESSHAYGSSQHFFNEVFRVLKPGGSFIITDFRDATDLPALKEELKQSGFKLVREELITDYIVKALELDHDRKLAVMEVKIPKILFNTFKTFAATKGSEIYEDFKFKRWEYFNYLLEKTLS